MASPTKFAHVVYNTHRYEEMIDWYLRVLEAGRPTSSSVARRSTPIESASPSIPTRWWLALRQARRWTRSRSAPTRNRCRWRASTERERLRDAVLTVSGASAAPAQQSIRPVPLTPFADGQDFVLMADLVYQIGATSHVIVVPAGFVTDFGSTPRSHLVGATATFGERGKRLSRR